MQSKKILARSCALLMALSLVAVGCGDDKKEDSSGDDSATTTAAQEETTDGVLTGMRGTTPLVDLDDGDVVGLFAGEVVRRRPADLAGPEDDDFQAS